MNITQIQSAIAPVLAPVAPAVMFGNSLYHGMLSDKIDSTLALVASVGGAIGIEVSGALACSMAVLAYHRKDYKIMWISIISSLIYATFVYKGISISLYSSAFSASVIISLIAYLMLGVYQSYTSRTRTQQAETDLRIKEMDAERKLTNAQARRSKLSTGAVHGGQTSQFKANAQMIKSIQDFWGNHPNATYREVATSAGCSPMTAGKYKPANLP